jgi:integrase
MGRKRTGHVARRGDKFYARLGNELVGIADSEEAARDLIAAALSDDEKRDPNTLAARGEKYMETEEELHRERRGNTVQFAKEWSLWRRHIRTSKLYQMPIDKIRPEHVQALLDSVVGSPRLQIVPQKGGELARRPTGQKIGRRTGQRLRSRLSHFFDTCLELSSNPAARRKVKNTRSNRQRVDGDRKPHLHADEVFRLFDLLEMTPEHRAVYAAGVYQGLRVDEIWGLRWENIIRLDGERPELHVRWSFNSPVKTEQSERDIPMLAQFVKELKAYRATLSPTPLTGVVFPGTDGRVRAPGSRARWEDKPYASAKGESRVRIGYRTLANIRPHLQFKHMRHTCGTHLLEGTFTNGHEWPLEKVSEFLGHDSIETTTRYYASRQVKRLHAEMDKSAAALHAELEKSVRKPAKTTSTFRPARSRKGQPDE